MKGLDHMCLENWHSSLAVTAREENLIFEGFQTGYRGIPKDGNILGPFAFKLKYPAVLKEAYENSYLIDKCPLLKFHDQFASLIGRP